MALHKTVHPMQFSETKVVTNNNSIQYCSRSTSAVTVKTLLAVCKSLVLGLVGKTHQHSVDSSIAHHHVFSPLQGHSQQPGGRKMESTARTAGQSCDA